MKQSRMPSPAILVAALTLVAALGGTALAGPGTITSKLSKKKVARIADKEINKLAPGLSVAHAETANTAASASTADTANTANSADPAAFAHVLTDGTVDAANSKGVTQENVTHSGGVNDEYCFQGLTFQPRGGQVTIDYSDTTTTGLHALFDLGGVEPTCPAATTQAHVNTVPDSTSFYIVFYR